MPPKAGTDMAIEDAFESGSEGDQDDSPEYSGLPIASTSAGSGASTGLGRRTAKAAAGKAAKRSRSSTVDSELPGKPKRKRNRAALSCAPCKKRKIKCDRKLPCESCIKRGEQASCRWEQPKVEPPPQIFALAVEHEQLKRRVAVLEAALARLAPDVFDPTALSNFVATSASHTNASARGGGTTAYPGNDDDEDEEEEDEDDEFETDNEVVEDAAQVLKDLAAQNHNTRSSTRGPPNPRNGTSLFNSAPHGPGSAVSASSPERKPSSTTSGHVGSPLRNSTSSSSAGKTVAPVHGVSVASMLNAPVEHGTSSEARGSTARHGSHTPEPIDEVAARAMSSLLCSNLSGSMSANGTNPAEQIRRAMLDEIYAGLPQRKAETDWMLNNYFTRVDWAWHLHHKPTFLAEYEAYSTLRAQGRKYNIDPLWLAYFALTLALSVKSLEAPISTPLLSITGQDLDELPEKFVKCAERALECAGWRDKPRFRTIQAIVLFAPIYLFAGNAAAVERYKHYLTVAIEMTQSLGLNLLGSDPRTMPALSEDDNAHTGLPPGESTLKRELALRLLSTLLFLDYTSIRSRTMLPPHMVTSALPGNYNDTDLVPEGIVAPRPDHLATDTSLDQIRHRIALEQYHFKEGMESRNGEPVSYEAVLATDARYQAILDDIPTDLSEAYIPPLGEPLMTLWRRSAVVQGIHSRILRLHRPYIARGRSDPQYRFSTERAVSAARVILATQVSLSSAPLLRGAFQIVNIQLAVLVLFSTIWQSGFELSREVEADVALITSIFGWLERHASSRVPEVKLVASSSLKAFKLVMNAYEERKTRQMALEPSAWPSLDEDESFGDALRRISPLVNVPDMVVAGAADESLYITPAAISAHSTVGGMSLESLLAPSPLHQLSSSSAVTSLGHSPYGSSTPISSTPRVGPDASSFDRTLLEGLEFGDPTFSWSTWSPLGPFATLGTY